MAISLSAGDQIKRVELHERYGGRRQGGISPSKQSPNVFLFTDQAQGALHGYIYDGAHEDGFYHYTGEGQHGDQQMVQGNKAVRDHKEEGRALHLFDASGGTTTYMGEFEYVDDYRADAPETNEGPMRSVIVFRLRRLSGHPALAPSRINQFGPEAVKEVPVEQHLTERMMVYPNRDPYAAERREQKLVRELEAAWLAQGRDVCRLQIRPEGEPAPLFCDLYDRTSNTLVEAKGSVARASFRMAIGQLADYERLVSPAPQKLILVPEEPRRDLLKLAQSQRIGVIWPDGNGGFANPS
ncbi:MAG TPA: hypothetical protein VFM51_01845 [Solirubrobacterales bacterium]|nr:hypothetical protein [Solirubrobacterales bacterium]